MPVLVVFVSEHAVVISLQESDFPPSLSPIPRVVRGSGCHVPGGSTSLSTQIWPIKALCPVCAAFVCWLTCSSHLRCHSAFFCGGRIYSCIVISVCPQIHFISVFQPTHPHRTHSFPSHPSLSSVSQPPPGSPFFSLKFSHYTHGWAGTRPPPTPTPPHSSIHKIIFDCRKHFLSKRSFREQGRTNK